MVVKYSAAATYLLGANIERALLFGVSDVDNSGNDGTEVLNGTGNLLANYIEGNAAANKLDGGAGNDTMTGGAGNDIYLVNGAGDIVTELAR